MTDKDSMKYIIYFGIICCGLFSCRNNRNVPVYPAVAKVPYEIVSIAGLNVPVHIGGYGSSMAYNEKDSTFWLLTDRGPNVDGITSESKIFALPDYNPHVGVFRLQGDSLIPVKKIELKDTNDRLFSGLPNVEGDGKTGETAYNKEGKIIHNKKRRGIDPEGLALAPDGSFWISDEYGPWILHFDSTGNLIGEYSPFNGKLPAHYAHRQPNRGMEGLSINKQGTVLYGIMQSPLNQPDGNAPAYPAFVRILELHLSDNSYREFAYPLENQKNVVSEINYLNDSTFLVLERDGKFPENGEGFKRIYQIQIDRASDISRYSEIPEWGNQLPANIKTVEKKLFCDILKAIPAYDHDKPEGIAMIGDSILCVVNDDDFGINSPSKADGTIVPKLKTNRQTDRNKIYFIPCQSR